MTDGLESFWAVGAVVATLHLVKHLISVSKLELNVPVDFNCSRTRRINGNGLQSNWLITWAVEEFESHVIFVYKARPTCLLKFNSLFPAGELRISTNFLQWRKVITSYGSTTTCWYWSWKITYPISLSSVRNSIHQSASYKINLKISQINSEFLHKHLIHKSIVVHSGYRFLCLQAPQWRNTTCPYVSAIDGLTIRSLPRDVVEKRRRKGIPSRENWRRADWHPRMWTRSQPLIHGCLV